MEDLKSAIEDHLDQMGDLLQKFSAELRSGLRPAYDNFLGFFHAIDWKVRSTPLSSLRVWLSRKCRNLMLSLCPGTLVNRLTGFPFLAATDSHFFEEEYQLPNVLVPFGM